MRHGLYAAIALTAMIAATPAAAYAQAPPPKPQWREYCVGDPSTPATAKCRFVVKPTLQSERAYLQYIESRRRLPGHATKARSLAAAPTVLVNDPAHPFTARQLASMRAWLDDSAEPTPAVLYVHRGECPSSVACANVNRDQAGQWYEDASTVGHVWLDAGTASHDRFAFMHEVGHVMDVERWTPQLRSRLEGWEGTTGDWRPDARFETYDPDNPPPLERAADGYAMCSIHPAWPGTWWHFVIRRHGKVVGAGANLTPYDFRAGRHLYGAICAAMRAAG